MSMKNSRPRVLLIQRVLQKYRIPIYILMQKEVDLTLAYTEKNNINTPQLKCICLPSIKLGKLCIQRHLYKILNQYDVVVSQPHFSNVRICLLPFFPRKFKFVIWDIGVRASYKTHFDLSKAPSLSNRILNMIQKRADACIFYYRKTIEYWAKYDNIHIEKYFEAHNTVEVADFESLPDYESRDSYLFVGTLYSQKGIEELIDAYSIAKQKKGKLPMLKIVGEGPEKNIIQKQIIKLGLETDIVLCGAIYDESILKNLFLKALLCISPKQAGLTVQKSLGYGTPFVTRPDAYTGGEILDVKNGENGFLYESVEDLSNLLIYADQKKQEMFLMSQNAREYYLRKCTPIMMADGALSAIWYSLENGG